ncbi:unnamed protein product [Mucor hiemalis]
MEEKGEIEKRTGFHANKLPHMGNRSTNRVEGTHAIIKLHNGTSSGKLELVTTKITEWWRIRANYRDSQAEVELFKQPLSIVKSKLSPRLNQLKNRITKFALEKVESELIESLNINSNDVSTPEDCTYYNKHVLRLPCRHQLLVVSELVPLDIIHSRWHIAEFNGQGNLLTWDNRCSVGKRSYFLFLSLQMQLKKLVK